MKSSKFTEAQIAFVLKQAEDGTPIAEVCRKAGISDATFYNWRKRYAGLMSSEMRRLRQLEEENTSSSPTCLSTRRCFRTCWQKMYGLPRPCKDFGRSDKHSLLKCIRPLASGLRLQPGHDEIRTRRSQLTGSCKSTLFCTGLTVRRSTVSSSRLRASQSGPGFYATDGSRRS